MLLRFGLLQQYLQETLIRSDVLFYFMLYEDIQPYALLPLILLFKTVHYYRSSQKKNPSEQKQAFCT